MINDTPESSKPFTATDNTTPQFQGIVRNPAEAALLEAYRNGDEVALRALIGNREYEFWLSATEKIAAFVAGKLALMGYLDRRDFDGGMWDLVSEIAAALNEAIPNIDPVSLDRARKRVQD